MTDKDLGAAAGDIFAKAFTLGYETGRKYVPAGGMALTAEQVEDVRTMLWSPGVTALPAFRRLRALFPATEPAEEAPNLAAVAQEPRRFDPADECQNDNHDPGCTCGAQHWMTTPAPAEPAEEETKAERDSQGIIRINGGRIVALSRDPRELVQQWYDLAEPGSKWQRDYAAALDLFDREAASSPVVPAPTETGPWQHRDGRICVYAPAVTPRLRYRIGKFNDHGDFVYDDSERLLPEGFAPFVAAEGN